MSTAQRPSNELANKSNVIPSINRLTEATAEDFRELAAILFNHADIIDGISRASEQSKFYGFHGSLAILQATFQNAQEGGFAVIDPGNGDPQQIARFSNGVWTAQEIKAPIQFYNSIITRPQTGQENTWYVIKDSGVIYLYYDGNWHPFGKNGINGASAYEIAKAVGGFTGTEAEWLASLKGDKGDKGDTGSKGDTGDSAYEEWLAAGNTGSEADFLASLQGPKGDKGETGDITVFTTDSSLYYDPATHEMRANVSIYPQEFTWNSGSQIFTLAFEPTNFILITVQGQGLSSSQYAFTAPNQLEILDALDPGDRIRVVYERFIIQP